MCRLVLMVHYFAHYKVKQRKESTEESTESWIIQLAKHPGWWVGAVLQCKKIHRFVCTSSLLNR